MRRGHCCLVITHIEEINRLRLTTADVNNSKDIPGVTGAGDIGREKRLDLWDTILRLIEEFF